MARQSIRSRLRLLVLGVGLPLVALAGFTIWTDFESSLQQARSRTNGIAAVTAGAIGQYLSSASDLGTALAVHPDLQALDRERCQALVRPLVELSGEVANIVVARADGSLVCAAVGDADQIESNLSQWAAVRGAITTGASVLRSPLRGSLSGELIAPMGTPVRDDDGTIIGVVSVSLGLDYLQDQVDLSPLPAGWLLTITDTASVVLSRSEDADEWILDTLPRPTDPEELADLSTGSGFNTTAGADGVRRLFAYRAVEGTPWIVWAGVPTDVIYAPVRATLYPKLALAGLVILFVLLFARLTGRQIEASLSGLSRQMEEVEGKPGALVTEEGLTEIAAVAEQYNRLLTARRKAEADAMASADLHELVMRATNDAVWDWDLRSDQVEVNQRFAELFGPPVETGGIDFWMSRVHPNDGPQMQRRIASLQDADVQTWSAEYRMKRADAGWAEVLDRCYAIRDESGEVVRVLGAIMDVTETRRARKTVEKSKERYRSVLRNAAFGIYIATLDGELIVSNPALREMLGFDKADALQTNERAFYLDPADREREVNEVLEKGEVGPLEAAWRTADGSVLTVRLYRTRFIDESGEVALEVIAEDLTERRRLEEQFRQAQKMEAVGQLAGGVAHDFNNRLTVIQGRGQLLRTDVADQPELIENVDAILESAESAARLTRELLAVSRKQLYQPKVLSLNELVEKLKPMLDTLLGEQYELELELAPPPLPPVLVDPGHLQQILMNLLVNARDAQPDGGRIVVRTGQRHVGEDVGGGTLGLEPGPYVTLSVVDQGSGIAPDVMERVFEPFFTTKPVGVGTGLGLATVYGLAKQNQGFVTIHSQMDEGTEVELCFPEAAGAPLALDKPRGQSVPRGNGASVLVVEDEDGVRAVLARTLQVLEYDVHQAANAAEALELPREILATLSVVVTDVVMPGMRGTELADRLQALYPDLPVLFISGYSHDGTFDPNADGRRDFLAKPFTPQALGMAVAGLLGNGTLQG